MIEPEVIPPDEAEAMVDGLAGSLRTGAATSATVVVLVPAAVALHLARRIEALPQAIARLDEARALAEEARACAARIEGAAADLQEARRQAIFALIAALAFGGLLVLGALGRTYGWPG